MFYYSCSIYCQNPWNRLQLAHLPAASSLSGVTRQWRQGRSAVVVTTSPGKMDRGCVSGLMLGLLLLLLLLLLWLPPTAPRMVDAPLAGTSMPTTTALTVRGDGRCERTSTTPVPGS